MIALKWLLVILGIGLFGSAGALVIYDVYVSSQLRRLLRRSSEEAAGGASAGATSFLSTRPFGPVRWQRALQLAVLAIVPLLISQSIVVVPDGTAGVRVSRFWGVRPGTLYPGVHLLTPFVDNVALYDTREQVYLTAAAESGKNAKELLTVQAREGLNIGIAVAVRYRIDPRRFSYIHASLPGDIGGEVVAPVVASTYRSLAPNYITREIFAVKREELRSKAAEAIKARLESDGILVREVVLRDIKLPEEHAKGLEGLLLKEQESERLGTEQEIKQKQVEDCRAGSGSSESARREASGSASAGSRAAGEGGSGLHAVHAAAEAEADRTIEAGSGSAQGSDSAKRRSGRASQSD